MIGMICCVLKTLQIVRPTPPTFLLEHERTVIYRERYDRWDFKIPPVVLSSIDCMNDRSTDIDFDLFHT